MPKTGNKHMNIIQMVNTQEFRIALMRHYIAQAFIDDMNKDNIIDQFYFNSMGIPLTPDRVSANIAYYIERENIITRGVTEGQRLNTLLFYRMLEPGFMTTPAPELSPYGYQVMTSIYERIADSGLDGTLPPEAEVQVLTGDIGL